MMSPVTVKKEDLARNRNTRGLTNLLEPATNYPDIWEGGLWRPADIARIEMTASRALLQMGAKFRQRYLRNFYEFGKANLAANPNDPQAFIVTAGQPNAETIARMLEILTTQGMEVYQMTRELHVANAKDSNQFHDVPLGSFLIFVNQPQKNNVLSLFEKQVYPHRLLPNGDAEAPYDVAGWTLPMQMGVEYETAWQIKDLEKDRGTLKKVEHINQVRATLNLDQTGTAFAKKPNPLKTNPRIGLYKGFTGSMDEGWTRLVLDTFQIRYRSVSDADMRSGNLDLDAIILPADSEVTIVNGLSVERYPAEFTGGIGDAGVANLKKFVDGGGKLICFDDSCEMVIKRFGLPMKNVLAGMRRNEFYNPGSIVKLDVDTTQPLARGLRNETAAYFTSSSAFDITDAATVKTIARYAGKDALLSGWMLGEKYLNGKTALAEASYGKGKIVLFAFRPQHRGQSWGTFPFIFNSLER